VVAFADGDYAGFDQWQVLTQSSAAMVAPLVAPENGTPRMMRLTQPNATAQRIGVMQWLESANVLDLRGKDIVLSARVRAAQNMTLRYAIVEWTGTADAITKDVVSNWASGTFTPGNFFTSTSTVVTATGSVALTANVFASIALTGTVGGSANNLAVVFWTDAALAASSTMDIGNVDLKEGTVASPHVPRSIMDELQLCQRYFCKSFSYGIQPKDFTGCRTAGFAWSVNGIFSPQIPFPVRMRINPTVAPFAPGMIAGATPVSGQWQWFDGASSYVNSSTTASDISDVSFIMTLAPPGTATSKSAYILNGNWTANARL
jgi:hypothetical protein